jgi:hypothetical protein
VLVLPTETISSRPPHDTVKDINGEKPGLYLGFTQQQFEAAVAGLRSDDIHWPDMNIKTERYFDLDVAKLLYVLVNMSI